MPACCASGWRTKRHVATVPSGRSDVPVNDAVERRSARRSPHLHRRASTRALDWECPFPREICFSARRMSRRVSTSSRSCSYSETSRRTAAPRRLAPRGPRRPLPSSRLSDCISPRADQGSQPYLLSVPSQVASVKAKHSPTPPDSISTVTRRCSVAGSTGTLSMPRSFPFTLRR